MIVRALSICQPWAFAVAAGWKPWENRPRRFHYRGPLLIHASKSFVRADYEAACAFIRRLSGCAPPDDLDFGGIVGAAMLVDCAEPLRIGRGWRGAGEYGLKFERAVVLPFRPYRGALGLFKVECTRTEFVTLKAVALPRASEPICSALATRLNGG